MDEQAESIFNSIDLLAERRCRIGGTTLRSITHISQLQSIVDDNDDFTLPEQMIQRLIDGNRQIAEKQWIGINIIEENCDSPTSGLLQKILDETEKRIWFLYEVSQGGHNKVAAHKPVNMSHKEAAVVPLAGMTSLQALRDEKL